MPDNTHIGLGVESAEIPAASRTARYNRELRPAEWYPAKRPWQVLLVDDNAAVRSSLKMLLEEHADLQLVGEAFDGEEAVVLAERYRPDVVLMDIRLPRVNGVEATRQIKNKLPQIMIIGMSSQYTPQSYNAMMAAGAMAFVCKEEAGEVLYKTLSFALSYHPHPRLGPQDRLNGEWSGKVMAAHTGDPFQVI